MPVISCSRSIDDAAVERGGDQEDPLGRGHRAAGDEVLGVDAGERRDLGAEAREVGREAREAGLERAQALLQRLGERAADRHRLADRLHHRARAPATRPGSFSNAQRGIFVTT